PHEGDLDSNPVQSDHAVHPFALDAARATVPLHAQLDKEGDGGFEVVHDDPDVVHTLDGHDADPPGSTSPGKPWHEWTSSRIIPARTHGSSFMISVASSGGRFMMATPARVSEATGQRIAITPS